MRGSSRNSECAWIHENVGKIWIRNQCHCLLRKPQIVTLNAQENFMSSKLKPTMHKPTRAFMSSATAGANKLPGLVVSDSINFGPPLSKYQDLAFQCECVAKYLIDRHRINVFSGSWYGFGLRAR
jgi:hypothetical protein